MVYGGDAEDDLSIGTEKKVGVELFHQLTQREVNDMFLTNTGNGKSDLIF